MNWQSLVIVGIIVILFIILMIINASTADLDQDDADGDVCCYNADTSDNAGASSNTASSTKTDG